MNEGKLIWITGLSGAGKTTLAKEIFSILKEKENNTVYLDGDKTREIFDNDLGYSLLDRKMNAYRIVKLCNFLVSQGMNVVCSTMSLYKEIHEFNKKNNKYYYDIFLEVDIGELIKRNQKNLYNQAIQGETNNVVGIDMDYDIPSNPFLKLDNNQFDISTKEKALKVLQHIGV